MRSLRFYRSISRLCQMLGAAALRYRDRRGPAYGGARRSDIPPHVQKLFDVIVSAFGDELTIEVFLLFIERQRDKPLRIVRCDMKTGTTGYVLAFPDCDVIFLRIDLTPGRARLVLFHECGHLLLKHVDRVSTDCEELSFDIVEQAPGMVLDAWFHDNDYDRPGEYEAESFATLMNRVLPVENTTVISKITKAVLGYRREDTRP